MITEIVRFLVPAAFDRAALLADAERVVPHWRDYPGLVRKHFVWNPETREALGVYLWQSRADAEGAHDAAWLARAEAHWGNRPRVERFECFLTLENPGGVLSAPPPERQAP